MSSGIDRLAARLSTPQSLPRAQRARITAIVGILCFFACYARLVSADAMALDFTWAWRGAKLLLVGGNPYHDPTLAPGNPYPNQDPLFYPMPAVLLALPFTLLPPFLAGAFFCSLSTAALTWFLTRDGYWRLPMLASAPYVYAMATAQWAPLLCLAAFAPLLLPLVTLKFNIGVPIFLGYATRRGVMGCAAVLLLTVVLFPWWPRSWWGNLGAHRDLIPILTVPGQLVLLALWRWRTREARVLLGSAIVPQVFYYDPVALWLIPQNFRRMMALTLASWIAPNIGPLFSPVWGATIGVASFYLPALACVLFPPPTATDAHPSG